MKHYVSAGHFRSEGVWIHPRRTIDSYEILFMLSGEAYLFEDGTHFALRPGDVLLLEPGREHGGEKTSENVSFYWVHFLSDTPPAFKCFHPRDEYEIASQIRRLLHIANTPGYESEASDAAVTLLADELILQASSASQAAESALIAQIIEYVRVHIEQMLSVETVARQYGYTAGYLSRVFRQKTGTGMKAYLEDERVKHAKGLLLTSNSSVKQIALKMSFRDEKSFIKFFTYHEGISPTRFRGRYVHTHQNIR